MGKINITLIKDIFISILIVITIILLIYVIFYDKISLNKVIPESEEYELSEEMAIDLNATVTEETSPVVTTYSIDAADLKKYEQNKEYNKGKKNPFAIESDIINDNSTDASSDTSIDTNSTVDSDKFYEDIGIK